MNILKAKQGDISDLFRMAWNHESMGGDDHEKRRLVAFAHEHQLTHLLPDEAHSTMHDMYIPHNHSELGNNPETGLHEHTVVKAFNPLAPLTGEVVKAWEDGDVAHWEGWLSTPRKDQEKDVTEPEAFIEPAKNYFARMAPVSLQHGLNYLPVGHLQKAAVVRDGKIIDSFTHPTDSADFEHFPGSGSGVWVRGVANEEAGRKALRKGNVGGMSFIANAAEKHPLPGGRYRYTKLDPWIESTIAAYPINPDAVIAVVKAFGVTPEKEPPTMTKSLEEILAAAVAAKEAEQAALNEQAITKADLGGILQEFKAALMTDMVDEVKKAFPAPNPDYRGEGTGRKGVIAPQDEREADPAAYLIKKAARGEEWDDIDKLLVSEITNAGLLLGLRE